MMVYARAVTLKVVVALIAGWCAASASADSCEDVFATVGRGGKLSVENPRPTGRTSVAGPSQMRIAYQPCAVPFRDLQHCPVLGPTRAVMTLYVFTDYACGYSRERSMIVNTFSKRNPFSRIVFILLPSGEASRLVAHASLAAAQELQQQAWHEFHMALMNSPNGSTAMDAIHHAAEVVGLELRRLDEAMERFDAEAVFNSNDVERRRMGVTGTPSFFLSSTSTRPQRIDGDLLMRLAEVKR